MNSFFTMNLHETKFLTCLYNPKKLAGDANGIQLLQNAEGDISGLMCSDSAAMIVYVVDAAEYADPTGECTDLDKLAESAQQSILGWHPGSMLKTHADGKTIANTGFECTFNMVSPCSLTIDSMSKGEPKQSHTDVSEFVTPNPLEWVQQLQSLTPTQATAFHSVSKTSEVLTKLSAKNKYVVTHRVLTSPAGDLLLSVSVKTKTRLIGSVSAIAAVQ